MIMLKEELEFWETSNNRDLEIQYCMKEQGFLHENATNEELLDVLFMYQRLFEELIKEQREKVKGECKIK